MGPDNFAFPQVPRNDDADIWGATLKENYWMKEITRIWSSKIWLSSWSVRLLRKIWLLLLELGTSRRVVGGHVFAFNFKTEVSLFDHIYKLLEQMTRKTDILIDW